MKRSPRRGGSAPTRLFVGLKADLQGSLVVVVVMVAITTFGRAWLDVVHDGACDVDAALAELVDRGLDLAHWVLA